MTRVCVLLLAVLLPTCSPGGRRSSDPSGATSTQPPAAQAGPSRLRVDGVAFRTAEGRRFDWRGLSAFRLVELVARGREKDVVALLDWAAAQNVNVVRVFVMAQHLFQLTPDEGRAALPRVLELAGARGLYVEVVALADTATLQVDFGQHVTLLAKILAAHPNSVLELANEPWHHTQNEYLHRPANLARLAQLVPADIPVAYGSAETDEGYAGGRYATWHSPRGAGEGGWQHVFSLATAADLVQKWAKPTISDEPIGAGAVLIPGRRDDSAPRFGAAAVVTRLAGLGATFHFEGGLHARVPSGAELACFTAWSSALDAVAGLPEGGQFLSGEAVRRIAKVQNARTAFGRDFGNEVWIALVDPREDVSMTWTSDWRLQTARNSPGVRLVHARR